MTRYDIYDQQLNPGDYICWCSKNVLFHGRIQAISLKGTIKVNPWRDELQLYSTAIVKKVKAWQIIKVLGIPKRDP